MTHGTRDTSEYLGSKKPDAIKTITIHAAINPNLFLLMKRPF